MIPVGYESKMTKKFRKLLNHSSMWAIISLPKNCKLTKNSFEIICIKCVIQIDAKVSFDIFCWNTINSAIFGKWLTMKSRSHSKTTTVKKSWFSHDEPIQTMDYIRKAFAVYFVGLKVYCPLPSSQVLNSDLYWQQLTTMKQAIHQIRPDLANGKYVV